MSSIVVKAYWRKFNEERADVGEEIRRFSVDQDVATNCSYLIEKIRLAFPSLRNRELTLFWKGMTITVTLLNFSSTYAHQSAVVQLVKLRIYLLVYAFNLSFSLISFCHSFLTSLSSVHSYFIQFQQLKCLYIGLAAYMHTTTDLRSINL